mmetsp:Transcript_29231/g.63571  ORF Transcript_29231/g.63571 Transcript_29231/m.63571 type:complete len:279 (-) Transcript_29231:43-879(-)
MDRCIDAPDVHKLDEGKAFRSASLPVHDNFHVLQPADGLEGTSEILLGCRKGQTADKDSGCVIPSMASTRRAVEATFAAIGATAEVIPRTEAVAPKAITTKLRWRRGSARIGARRRAIITTLASSTALHRRFHRDIPAAEVSAAEPLDGTASLGWILQVHEGEPLRPSSFAVHGQSDFGHTDAISLTELPQVRLLCPEGQTADEEGVAHDSRSRRRRPAVPHATWSPASAAVIFSASAALPAAAPSSAAAAVSAPAAISGPASIAASTSVPTHRTRGP